MHIAQYSVGSVLEVCLQERQSGTIIRKYIQYFVAHIVAPCAALSKMCLWYKQSVLSDSG